MGIEPFLIASSVRAFIAQRLVRTLCESCKKPATGLDDEYLQRIGFPMEHKDNIMEPVGCRNCRDTGYRGRMAIIELCALTAPMQELITGSGKVSDMKVQAREDGMLPLRKYGWEKVAEGKTTIAEVLTNTGEAD